MKAALLGWLARLCNICLYVLLSVSNVKWSCLAKLFVWLILLEMSLATARESIMLMNLWSSIAQTAVVAMMSLLMEMFGIEVGVGFVAWMVGNSVGLFGENVTAQYP